MILIGELSLWVALPFAAWAAIVSFKGGAARRGDLIASGERAILAVLVLLLLASAGLWTALLKSDFSLKYVASFSSSVTPALYKFAAFWSGQAGALLLGALFAALYSAITIYGSRSNSRALTPFVSGTLGVVLLFLIAVLCLGTNPFERLSFVPAEGRGGNPQLQNVGMALHLPSLYLGYVGTAIPFAFAIAALVTGKLDSDWLRAVRRWALLSWFFLSLAILIGMWGSYTELGAGTYWAWNPVENASLLPWLATTAFLHAAMVQEKRGMLRRWNVTLLASAFLAALFGIFITRDGVDVGALSFTQSATGKSFLGFVVLAIGATALLVFTRLRDRETTASLESMWSRETAFLYGNVVFVGIALAVLWGSFFPMLGELSRGVRVPGDPEFFNNVTVPLGLLLLLLTGIGPLLAWRSSPVANLRRELAAPAIGGLIAAGLLVALGMRHFHALMAYALCAFVAVTIGQEFLTGASVRRRMYGEAPVLAFLHLLSRNRRRYGGYMVHAGFVVLVAAFAGIAFRKVVTFDIQAGGSMTARDPFGREWSFTNQGVSDYNIHNARVLEVALAASVDGRTSGLISSQQRQHLDRFGNSSFPPSTRAGIQSRVSQDVYVVLSGLLPNQAASVRVEFNPLVTWVWLGGMLLLAGGAIVMWPRAHHSGAESGYAASLVRLERATRDDSP